MLPTWLTDDTLKLLWQGLTLTLWLTAITSVLALVIGLLVGIGRISETPFKQRLATIFVAIFRNTPALVQLIFWAFAVPNIVNDGVRQTLFYQNGVMAWINELTGLVVPWYAIAAILALSLNSAAYISELFRAGVGTIKRQHLETARTLGATPAAVLRQIIIPLGLHAAFPAISTRLIHNMKNTALASFVAVPEFFNITQGIISKTFNAVALLSLAALVYLLLSLLMAAGLHQIDCYMNRGVG